jgi:hypothetical protein
MFQVATRKSKGKKNKKENEVILVTMGAISGRCDTTWESEQLGNTSCKENIVFNVIRGKEESLFLKRESFLPCNMLHENLFGHQTMLWKKFQ